MHPGFCESQENVETNSTGIYSDLFLWERAKRGRNHTNNEIREGMKNEIKETCIAIASNTHLEIRGGGHHLRRLSEILAFVDVALLCSLALGILDVLDDDEMVNHRVLLFSAMIDEGRASTSNGHFFEKCLVLEKNDGRVCFERWKKSGCFSGHLWERHVDLYCCSGDCFGELKGSLALRGLS